MNSSCGNFDDSIAAAAEVTSTADALLIGAGAGMGVDSGLPDFRGNEGFWKAYPPFRGQSFASLSTPHWFTTDPSLAWGFFGHRLNLYRDARPHAGFQLLLNWGQRMPLGCFVYTSNVDGQFQRAGFSDEIVLECHGSIHHLQCSRQCTDDLWSADSLAVEVDAKTIRCQSELPRCQRCRAVARPAILMFGDSRWIDSRSQTQHVRYEKWLRTVKGCRLVAIEMGAGLAIPTVRYECEGRAAKLIRINPREAETPQGGISLPMGALEALTRIANEPSMQCAPSG